MKQTQLLFLAALCAALIFPACKKAIVDKPAATSTSTKGPDDLVPTPGGLLPRSHVHLIENGYKVTIRSGHMLKVDAKSGETKVDFGEIHYSQSTNLKSIAPAGNPWNASAGAESTDRIS